jgi:hypothetical protein
MLGKKKNDAVNDFHDAQALSHAVITSSKLSKQQHGPSGDKFYFRQNEIV